jgi:Domain of unknown function (DUF6745)
MATAKTPTQIKPADLPPEVWERIWAEIQADVDRHPPTVQQLESQIWASVQGQYEANYLGFMDFFRRYTDVEGPEQLVGLIKVAQASGWWWPFSGAVILTERPLHIHRDAQNRLHHANEAAILYPDGFGVWAWHGVRVPREMIEDKWSVQDILRHNNAEVRRCAIERMGWDQFILAAKLKQVGKAVDDPANPGYELSLYDVPESIYDAPVRVLLCTNATIERDGTRRRFGLTVPANIADPLSAAAWTFGQDPKVYATLQHAY